MAKLSNDTKKKVTISKVKVVENIFFKEDKFSTEICYC